MRPSFCVLAAFLLACAALAAPAPEPFVSGWSSPVNPDRDCKIRRDNGALTIELPGGDHDYDPLRGLLNAPRILRDIEGDFAIQVRVQIKCHLSVQSTAKGQPALVSAGFLLIFPEKSRFTCDRMEYGVSQQRFGTDGYAALKALDREEGEDTWIWTGAGDHTFLKTLFRKGNRTKEFRDKLGSEWPWPKKAEYVYLRLEQREGCFYSFISPDGEKWTGLLYRSGPPSKFKLGLAAYSTSSEPSKVRFDKLKLTRGKKKER